MTWGGTGRGAGLGAYRGGVVGRPYVGNDSMPPEPSCRSTCPPWPCPMMMLDPERRKVFPTPIDYKRGNDRMAKSKLRPLRVPDDPYFPACARASGQGTSIGRVTTELLRMYAAGEIDVKVLPA